VQDEMLFIHRGDSSVVTSSVTLMGPETYDNLGNEIYLTNNRLPKGTGKEHLVDSNISDDGTTISLISRVLSGSSATFNGCLGIGTANPSQKLHVVGTGDSTKARFELIGTAGINEVLQIANTANYNPNRGVKMGLYVNSGSNSNQLGAEIGAAVSSVTSAYLFLSTTNSGTTSEKVRIIADGNVGIGNTSPQARLDLGTGYGASGEKFFIYNDNNTSALAGTKVGFYMDRFGLSNNSTYVFPTSTANPGSYIMASKDTAGTTLVARVTVLGESGYVGIGTTSPSATLDVVGAVRGYSYALTSDAVFRGGLYPYKFISGTGTDYGVTIFAEGGTGNGNIYFCPGGSATRAMTLTTNGNLLINSTSEKTTTAGKLQVTGGIHSSTGFYTTGVSQTVSALNTDYVIKAGAYSGLIVIRDNTNGGSGVWLADPNMGFIQIANNMPGAFTISWNGSNTVLRKTSGNVPINLGIAFYSNEFYG
jgi:hypothetical protein